MRSHGEWRFRSQVRTRPALRFPSLVILGLVLCWAVAAPGQEAGQKAGQQAGLDSGCGDHSADSSKATAVTDPVPLFIEAKELGLTCYPARIAADEGRWTFFLRGRGIIDLASAKLKVAGAEYAAVRIDFPTPTGVLIDFVLPPLVPGSKAELILLSAQAEKGRLPIHISGPAEVPVGHRQPNFVRLQLRDGTLLYPTHAGGGYRAEDGRRLVEIGGDEEFRAVLRDMGIEWIRKIMSNLVEGDTVKWDERNHREIVYGSEQLRMYLAYLDPQRSEEAFREIFRSFPQVERVWVNDDMETRIRKKRGG